MPASAVRDLTEWDPRLKGGVNAVALLRLDKLLKKEQSVEELIAASPDTPALTDDRPVNEYYLLRRWTERRRHSGGTPVFLF